MKAARTILCERTGVWADSLRRELSAGVWRTEHEPLERIVETRSLPEAADDLAKRPSSLVIIEVTSTNLEAAADFVRTSRRRYPRARLAIVGDAEWAATEFMFCELGVCVCSFSIRNLEVIAHVSQRHFARLPAPRLSWREEVWNRLPWKRYAETAK